jgi:hypothetical protein
MLPRIQGNTIGRDMPRLFRRMEPVHVAPPSGQPVVPLPHVEHLAHKVDKIGVGGHPCIESFTLKLPQRTPGGRDVLRDLQDVVLVVVDGNIENTVTISVPRNEFVLQPLDIQLVDGPNEWQIPQAAEGDAKSRLLKRPNAEAIDDCRRILFLLRSKIDLTLLGVSRLGRFLGKSRGSLQTSDSI